MRLALYIKTLGAEPAPFEHTSFSSCVVDLDKQYEQLKTQLGPKRIEQADRAVHAVLRPPSQPPPELCAMLAL